jgi:hypothetical protein
MQVRNLTSLMPLGDADEPTPLESPQSTHPTSYSVHPTDNRADAAQRQVVRLAALAAVLTSTLIVLIITTMVMPTSAVRVAAAAAPRQNAARGATVATTPLPIPVVATAPTESEKNAPLGRGQTPHDAEKTAKGARPPRAKGHTTENGTAVLASNTRGRVAQTPPPSPALEATPETPTPEALRAKMVDDVFGPHESPDARRAKMVDDVFE